MDRGYDLRSRWDRWLAMTGEFLGLTSVAWQALGVVVTSLTFISGAVAALVAARQLRLNRAIRDLQARPYVICDIVDGKASRHLKDFSVKNIGTTPAFNVEITFTPPPERAKEIQGLELKTTPMFTKPIVMLAPNREQLVFFDSMIARRGSQLPRSYSVSISYDGTPVKQSFAWLRADKMKTPRYADTFNLDVGASIGTPYAEVYGVHDLVKRIDDISTRFARSALGRRVLNVVTESRSRFDERERLERNADLAEHDDLVDQILPKRSQTSETPTGDSD